jgi:four helix bundle protein
MKFDIPERNLYPGVYMRNFRELQVWEKAHKFTLELHALTRNFPKEETHGLKSQLRRAAASIPAKIAEGSGRHGKQDFARFLEIALGSAKEADYQLLLSKDLGYLKEEDYNPLLASISEIQKMLSAFTRTLRAKQSSEHT